MQLYKNGENRRRIFSKHNLITKRRYAVTYILLDLYWYGYSLKICSINLNVGLNLNLSTHKPRTKYKIITTKYRVKITVKTQYTRCVLYKWGYCTQLCDWKLKHTFATEMNAEYTRCHVNCVGRERERVDWDKCGAIKWPHFGESRDRRARLLLVDICLT